MKSSINAAGIRKIILILTIFCGHACLAQDQHIGYGQPAKFYLGYSISGLGSNLGRHMPTLRVYDNKFIYTREQNSYWGTRHTVIQFISEGILQQGAVDSLLAIMKTLGDTTIFEANPCIMSGVITFVSIACDSDTAKFTLGNTAHPATLQIKHILDPYLPKEEKLNGSAELIAREESCKRWLFGTGKERRQERRKERRSERL